MADRRRGERGDPGRPDPRGPDPTVRVRMHEFKDSLAEGVATVPRFRRPRSRPPRGGSAEIRRVIPRYTLPRWRTSGPRSEARRTGSGSRSWPWRRGRGWAASPRPTSRRSGPARRRPALTGARRGDRTPDEPRRRRVRRRPLAEPMGEAGPVAPLRPDLVRPARHGPGAPASRRRRVWCSSGLEALLGGREAPGPGASRHAAVSGARTASMPNRPPSATSWRCGRSSWTGTAPAAAGPRGGLAWARSRAWWARTRRSTPRVEEYVCAQLGLRPAEAASQVIQRDVHAEFCWALAITAATLEQDGDRGPSPRPDRGPRGPGAVRRGAEGLHRPCRTSATR